MIDCFLHTFICKNVKYMKNLFYFVFSVIKNKSYPSFSILVVTWRLLFTAVSECFLEICMISVISRCVKGTILIAKASRKL